jgi:two-component system chemotaxis response regulator CheB
VQDPEEAPFPSMPLNALQDADIDYKLKAAEIGVVVGRIVNGDLEPPQRSGAAHSFEATEFSSFTCPECRGPLYSKDGPGPVEFRCRVGHILSLETLVEEATSTQERKLYEAIVALEEGSDLASFAAKRMVDGQKERFLNEALQLREFASAIRQMIERRDEPPLT